MKIEKMNKQELNTYCESLGIETKTKNKTELINAIYDYERFIIENSIMNGNSVEVLEEKISKLVDKYASSLKSKIIERKKEMKRDDNSHYLIYRILGVSNEEGMLIDEYQNTGRFLYKYAGSFLEDSATLCLFFANRNGRKTLVKNNQGSKPKNFEIDFLNGNDAVELKWRDAKTDGDHITKEHTRVKVIQSYGYKPIRVMFYDPQREQAIKIQETLKTIYAGVNGEYYSGEKAWDYLTQVSGYDLKTILMKIVDEREKARVQ